MSENNIIPFHKPEKKCNFCGSVVTRKFIENKQNGKIICYNCVVKATQRLEEETKEGNIE